MYQMLSEPACLPLDVRTLPPVITQRDLANKLNLHYNTVCKRHRKLKLLLPYYKELTTYSEHLTRYQAWCLCHYQRLASLFLNDQRLIVKYFKDKPQEFSFYRFNQEIKEVKNV